MRTRRIVDAPSSLIRSYGGVYVATCGVPLWWVENDGKFKRRLLPSNDNVILIRNGYTLTVNPSIRIREICEP